jgi:pyridoxal 5-phosphate dependent beta-lyase
MSVRAWVEDRVPTDLLHLDTASAGRVSRQVLEAELAHLRREAAAGAYVAEQEADLGPGREALAAQVGLGAGDAFFAEGAAQAFACLLDAWPLGPGSRIGTVPGQFGGHARRRSAAGSSCRSRWTTWAGSRPSPTAWTW